MSYLFKYEEYDGRYIAFKGDPKGGKITGKGKISTDTECVVLSPDFKRLDESQVLLRVPRKNNMCSVDLKNVAPSGSLTYPLGKFDRKADEGFIVGYSMNSKAFRVFNSRTRIVEDSPSDGFKPSGEEEKKDAKDPGNKDNEVLSTEEPKINQEKDANVNSTNKINTVSPIANAAEEIFHSNKDEDVGAEADMANLDTNILIYRNKKDKRCIVVRNKENLVAHGYTQEEEIDYDEVFAPVARIEALRLFLAYASFKDFIVYQMDVKSAFLYGIVEEEVYVCQHLGFEDLEFHHIVYKVEKALYGLHQAPKAWFETLSTYLLDNGFHTGQIDRTLFIKRVKGDILLVQVYVDDIIFGSTRKVMCTEFKNDA
nr:retrovirus-related Pol polyprotein from transposon TNT 1-94 [Tanacetum cinerariifolium]